MDERVMKEEGAKKSFFSVMSYGNMALKKLIADKVTVTAEDLKKGYESNYGPRAEILAIVCSNQRLLKKSGNLLAIIQRSSFSES